MNRTYRVVVEVGATIITIIIYDTYKYCYIHFFLLFLSSGGWGKVKL